MSASDLFPFIFNVFDRIRQMRADRRAEGQQALSAFGEALISTQRYLRAMSDGNRDLDQEAGLARQWQQAAESVRAISPDLAQAAASKMRYWTHPEGWEENEIRAAGIEIDQVFDRYSDLLTQA